MQSHLFQRGAKGPKLKAEIATDGERHRILITEESTGKRLPWDKKNPYRERCALYEDLIVSLLVASP